MKNALLVIVALVAVVIAAYFLIIKKNTAPSVEYTLNQDDFGYATFELIKSGQNVVACEDAKSLLVMINSINEDFTADPHLSLSDNMTPAMRDFELQMDKFGSVLEGQYANDNETLAVVLEGVGLGFSNLFQVTVMQHIGMLQPEQINEYIEITYCGATPSPEYVDPLILLEQSLIGDNATPME